MNLNEAEIAVTTKRLVTVNPKKSYRMELADYCDIDEFHHACATRFPEEAEPEYRYTDWENIPEYMVSSEWLCPNFSRYVTQWNGWTSFSRTVSSSGADITATTWRRKIRTCSYPTFRTAPMHGWLCGRRKNPMWRRTTWSIRVSLPTIHS